MVPPVTGEQSTDSAGSDPGGKGAGRSHEGGRRNPTEKSTFWLISLRVEKGKKDANTFRRTQLNEYTIQCQQQTADHYRHR